MTREELAEYHRSERYKFRSELMCLANGVGNAKDAANASVALDKLEDFIISREKLLLEKIGKPLREAIVAYPNHECMGCRAFVRKIVDEALAIIEKESKQ